MNKIRMLGIAPYEGIASLMRQAAEQRKDVELTVFVGDMEKGAEIAGAYTQADVDVVLSRGGTAERIRENSVLPVTDIPLSLHDILRSIKLAQNYNNKYAIIGFPAITKNAHFLCDVLRYNIEIFTIHTQEEAKQRLEQLSLAGYEMVLCDVITHSLAQRYRLSAILITSGAESVEAAMEQAVQTVKGSRRFADQIGFYKAMLEELCHDTFVFDATGKLVCGPSLHMFGDAVTQKMHSILPQILQEGNKRIYLESSGTMYVLLGNRRNVNGKTYAIFTVTQRRIPFVLSRNGMTAINKEEAVDQFFNSFFGIVQSTFLTGMTLDQYAQSDQPVMILGEVGTGKNYMANLLYARSKRSDHPMITIDCKLLHEKGWEYMMTHDNSPLSDVDTTIYIKNIRALSEREFAELFTAIRDFGVHQRNRLLLSYSYKEEDGVADRCRQLTNMFSCLTLFMPPLRSHRKDIPNLCSLYISMLNMEMAKEIVGFEPEALGRLCTYVWPYNFDQFKRVLQQLVTATKSSHIQLEEVERQLHQEEKLFFAAPRRAPSQAVDLSLSLEEINLQVVRQVMLEENRNQSAVAKRLGISRTTLWRMLQKLS